MAANGAPYRGADTAPTPVAGEKQVQLALIAASSFGVQRPESLIGLIVALSSQRHLSAMETSTLDSTSRAAVAAASIVGIRSGPGAVAMLRHGDNNGVWIAAPEPVPVKQPKDPRIVKTDLNGVEDDKEVQGVLKNPDEARAYVFLLAHAREVSPLALDKAARRNLTYVHVYEQPDKYRGEIIHISGRLKRLISFDAPRSLERDGVKSLYEAWIFPEEMYSNPYCVVFTELPSTIKTGEDIKYQVECNAYVFKRYRYKAKGDASHSEITRLCPLLLARSISLQPIPAAPPGESEIWTSGFAPTLMILIVGLVVLIIGLNWWFRRGDQVVRSRLPKTTFVEPVHGEEPENPLQNQPSGEHPALP